MKSLGCSTDIHTVAVAFEFINYITFFMIGNSILINAIQRFSCEVT